MHHDLGIRLQVSDRSFSLLDVVLGGPSALFGSSSHCDAQLGPEWVAPEQLRLEVRAGGVFADVLASTPPVTVNGVPFRGGRVLDETELRVGTLRLRISLEQQTLRDVAASDIFLPRNALLLLVAAVLATTAAGFVSFGTQGAQGDVPHAPALFAQGPDIACQESAGPSALMAAEELLVDAETRHERASFETYDGVRAVHAYRRAAACFLAGGDAARAREVQQAGARFEKQVAREFHLHQVRLYRAMALGNQARARAEVQALHDYLTVRDDPYVAWLEHLQRGLDTKGRDEEVQSER